MPVRPGNFARSESPYFHTHHNDCTTQHKAEIDLPMSKTSLSNNRLNGKTNCNVSRRESCDLHVTLLVKHKKHSTEFPENY